MKLLLCSLLSFVFAAGMATAQTQAVADAAEKLAIADALLQTADGAEQKADALSATVRAYEDAVAALRSSLTATAAENRRLERVLHGEGQDQQRLITGLLRLSQQSEPMLAFGRGRPSDLVLGGALLERVNAATQARIGEIEGELAAMTTLQAAQVEQRSKLETALAALRGATEQLNDESVLEGASLPNSGEDASNLAALAIALSGVPEADGGAGPADPHSAPVKGRITVAFNQRTEQAGRRPGVLIASESGALVSSPVDATVRFAGTLDGYGRVVILEPEAGQLFVFAGLDRLLVRAGAQVNSGRGIGFVPGEPVLHEEFLQDSAEVGGEMAVGSVYIEVRLNGTPVDPALWFAFDS